MSYIDKPWHPLGGEITSTPDNNRNANCTLGDYVGLRFPHREEVISQLKADFVIDEETESTLRTLAKHCIRANDIGHFAVARLYLSRIQVILNTCEQR